MIKLIVYNKFSCDLELQLEKVPESLFHLNRNEYITTNFHYLYITSVKYVYNLVLNQIE